MLDNAASYERDPVGKRLLEPGLGQGLLTSEGAVWKRQRRMMAPLFQPRRLSGFAAIMTERSVAPADRLSRQAHGQMAGPSVRTAGQMVVLTLEHIAHTMFGACTTHHIHTVGPSANRRVGNEI